MDGITLLVLSATIRFSNRPLSLMNLMCQAGGVAFVNLMLLEFHQGTLTCIITVA